ncbi:MAG: Rnase Y domain-containing protein [Patescibacteria group bacterium]
MIISIIYIGGGMVLGLVGGLIASKNKKFINLEKDRKTAEDSIRKSENEAEEIKNTTKENIEKRKEFFAQLLKRREERVKKNEDALKNKEEFIKKREERLKEAALFLTAKKEEIKNLQENARKKEQEITDQLTKKANVAAEKLKTELIESYKAELRESEAERLAKVEESLKEEADKTAKKIIVNTLQRLSSPTSVESRAVTIEVPRDQIKGKIVGRNGQNIQEFESLINVDVVFNDMPNVISISSFNLVDRRIAQRAMERLVQTRGDITKDTIKKALQDAIKETGEELYKIGETALKKMGIKAGDKEFCKIVGRLQYRTSYGQNIMKHSMEVGWVATMLGSEIGLNTETCKVAGFLHDLGKAIDQNPDVKDAHDFLTKELMEKYGFSHEEVHAAWTHHDNAKQETPEALIVKASDAVSASRPGARQESFERYIERIQALERTAMSFEGIKNAFAISAGREVRVIADPEVLDDNNIKEVAKKLAAKIEKEITYPGKIKVNIIRKTKYTETAK